METNQAIESSKLEEDTDDAEFKELSKITWKNFMDEIFEESVAVPHTGFRLGEKNGLVVIFYRGEHIGCIDGDGVEINVSFTVPALEYACWGDLGRAVEMAKTMIKEN
jgi:hypothetical protein